MSNGVRRAFIIMPFAEGFDEVYNLFIADTMLTAGYEVIRADDIRSYQNILKDIVLGIAGADLIVADLTDANPNVYYELGIAHALHRPVILLTQRIDDVPFDLRSYRVIPYSTHFAEIARAREQLLEVAKKAAEGSIPFGNPVSDFLGSSYSVARPEPASSGEAGLLDHLIAIEEGFEALTAVVGEHAAETQRIGEATTEAAPRLALFMKRGSVREARAVMMGLAQKLTAYAEQVADQNDRYARILGDLRTALEYVLRAQAPKSDEEAEQLRSLLGSLETVEQHASTSRSATSGLAETLRNTPSAERSYNHARDRAVRELERFAGNTEQTVATIARAREIGESKLPRPGSVV